MILIFILIRVFASPFSNFFQKKLTNSQVSPLFVVLFAYTFLALISLPVLWFLEIRNIPNQFWMYMILVGVLDAFGNFLLVKSLQNMDLSLFGPLNAFKPVIALLFGIFILYEIPSVKGLIGMLIIVLGSYFLNMSGERNGNTFALYLSKGFWLRISGITLSAVSAVIIKKVVLLSNPLTALVFWAIIGSPFLILIYAFQKKEIKQKDFYLMSAQKLNFLGLFLSITIMQLFTLFTFQKVFVGYSLALFQLSSVINVLMGFFFLKEKDIKMRLLGSFIMIFGTLLILIK
ncbi:DMT family transporter [Flexithrix dorotheae]|uniref:DMT family transporter n=1 Tax=Flexithrix dorotheae TaxID=70993 RepID=UPI0003685FD1|nr:DMT family transporter [Flexithrix dorotheae]